MTEYYSPPWFKDGAHLDTFAKYMTMVGDKRGYIPNSTLDPSLGKPLRDKKTKPVRL